MIKKYKDVFCGGALILLGAGLYAASFGIKSVALNLIKADFFPRLDAALLVLLGVILVITGLVKARRFRPPEDKPVPFWKNDGTVSMLETLALITVYLFALKPVGFLLSTFVYLTAQMLVLAPREKRGKKDVALFVFISAVTALTVYLVFVKVFYLMLPAGILRI